MACPRFGWEGASGRGSLSRSPIFSALEFRSSAISSRLLRGQPGMGQLQGFNRNLRCGCPQTRSHPFHWVSLLKVPALLLVSRAVHQHHGEVLALDLALHNIAIPGPEDAGITDALLQRQG